MKLKPTKRATFNLLVICLILGIFPKIGLADNPIIANQGVCDPHIHIFNGKAYLYATHDEKPGNTAYTMNDWWLWSSPDLVNWTKEFTLNPANTYIGPWTKCYATDGATRNGKFYFYFSKWSWDTGVAVSTNGPAGPYTDVLGKALTGGWDPTAFIDDDVNKTPYLIFGGYPYKIAKLNEDMISFAETPRTVTYVNGGWDTSADGNYIHKHNGIYYLNQHGQRYGTSSSVYGPYTYRGQYYSNWNDHATFFVWNNQDYCTYGTGDTDGFFRKTIVTYVYYKNNGDITLDDAIIKSSLGVGQYDATKTIQAEWYFAASDSISKNEGASGFELRNLGNNAYLNYPNVRNTLANTTISFRVSSANTGGGTIEVHEGSTTGTLLGSCAIPNTGSWTTYQNYSCTLANSQGNRNIYLVFKGKGTELMRLDYFTVQGFTSTYTLTTSATNGSVTPSGGTYNAETAVTLNASPISGYQFSSWSGDLIGTTNPTSLIMNANKSVTANFMLSGPINAFSQIEAENYSSQSGIQKETCGEGGQNIGYIENGDYITFNNVNFSTGAAQFQARVASSSSGGSIEVRLDGLSGTLVGTCSVESTTGWQTWVTKTCTISGAIGVHTLYLKFTGGSGYLMNLNWVKFISGGTTNYTLTTSATNGSVIFNPPGGTYSDGTIVTITAKPDAGYKFSGWAGDMSGSNNPATITMNSTKNITASFLMVVGSNSIRDNGSKKTRLDQNYPNPFSTETTIPYKLEQASHVKLSVYTIFGQQVATLVNEYQSAGDYNVVWNTNLHMRKDLVNGSYLFYLETGLDEFYIKKSIVN